MTFGPRTERNYALRMPEKMRRKALFVALSGKVRDNEIAVLSELPEGSGKTKEIAQMVKNLSGKKILEGIGARGGKALLVTSESSPVVKRAASNLAYVDSLACTNLNAVTVLSYKYLVMPENAIGIIAKTYGEKARRP